ncbi:MAG: hypothetical protein HOP37_09100 [Cyclobacteriaceae bacterium]|nr:hypothetical protein [Cyclobacteriaceae bacterium]
MDAMPKYDFPRKVFLSGADCFHLMLEINSKKYQTGNNVIRIVLHFNNEDSALPILSNIHQSPLVYWFCNIRLVKGFWFQKPHWKFEDQGNTIEIREHKSTASTGVPVEILDRKITIDNKSQIEFDLIRYPSQKVAIIISWHHIVMDARGSRLLTAHLSKPLPSNASFLTDFFPAKPKRGSLIKYIKNMYEVKHFIENSSRAPIATVSQPGITKRNFKIQSIHFTTRETEHIDKTAKENGARFGANAFLLACCAHLVNEINKMRGSAGTIWLPVPYDGRKRGGNGPIVTNCISFVFYRLPQSDLTSLQKTVASINQQMSDQIKNDGPKKFNMLLDMMRYFPLRLHYFLSNRPSKGMVSSFLYTSAGEDTWDTNRLLTDSIEDVLIIPPLVFPPGLTFSFSRHNNTLRMNIVYCSNILKEAELEVMHRHINRFLESTVHVENS